MATKKAKPASEVEVVRTVEEIEDLMSTVSDAIDEGGRFEGMTYEEGIQSAIDWMLGNIDTHPMAEDRD